MKHREERRRFWSAVVARFEGSRKSRREFAGDAGVGLAIFQYWLYKLRRERGAALVRQAAPKVRLVPVTVRAGKVTQARIDILVSGVRLRVPVGADAKYIAQLAIGLREERSC